MSFKDVPRDNQQGKSLVDDKKNHPAALTLSTVQPFLNMYNEVLEGFQIKTVNEVFILK